MNFVKILFLQKVVHKLLYSTVEVLFLLIIFVVNKYTHICTMIEVISKQEWLCTSSTLNTLYQVPQYHLDSLHTFISNVLKQHYLGLGNIKVNGGFNKSSRRLFHSNARVLIDKKNLYSLFTLHSLNCNVNKTCTSREPKAFEVIVIQLKGRYVCVYINTTYDAMLMFIYYLWWR